ncbi:MAG: PAS domain-containing protein [Candidatus Bipolaricaulaceae bacterium]
MIPADLWPELRAQFDEIGYCCFTPAIPPVPVSPVRTEVAPPPVSTTEIRLRFPTGELAPEELEAILNTLPVDITFVDKDDTVRYYNAAKDRIFVRTPAVIGRKVQNCHPQKSLSVVERILTEFREKKREVAEFWIHFQGNFVYIRYFPVWSRTGEYLGTLEVTQDITRIQGLSGEKRLLDEGVSG